MEICTKCGLEIMLNKETGVWETEDVVFCIVGPTPFKHVPPWSVVVRTTSKNQIVFPGFTR